MPVFDHLAALTDDRGLFEHALFSAPRREHGYCVDDAARALVVVCREADATPRVRRLERTYLNFVLAAIDPDGGCHNRMGLDGEWHDDAAFGDWWGRALWGLGVAAVGASTSAAQNRALAGFRVAAARRSPHRRAMAYAALGAAEVLRVRGDEEVARHLLISTVECIGPIGTDPSWPWPEPRLTYGNGTLAEALIVAGAALPDAADLERGLVLLDFLLRVQIRDGHLSVTPAGGRGPRDTGPAFDQQPIEVAALADACTSAYRATRDVHWLDGVRLAWEWFLGRNDSATPMADTQSGAGYDGLEAAGRNLNQGAESTVAMLSTAQHAQCLTGER
jgi:hypothetical protein